MTGALTTVLLFGLLVVLAAQIGANQVAGLRKALVLWKLKPRVESCVKNEAGDGDKGERAFGDPRDPLYMGQEGASEVVVLPVGDLGAMAVVSVLVPQAMRVSMGVHLTPETNTEAFHGGPSSLSLGPDLAFLFVFSAGGDRPRIAC